MSYIKWSQFAHATINMLGQVKKDEKLIILADTNTDMDLAQACLAEGINVTKHAHLLVIRKRKMDATEETEFNAVTHNAIINADIVIAICETSFAHTAACRIARENGGRLIQTTPVGIEEYVIEGVINVDYEKMVQNGKRMAELWGDTKVCKVTSDLGTDISFELTDRPALLGDGIASEKGKLGFFPGVQVNIAPVESTINGKVVVDGSVSPGGGIVSSPIHLTLENGKIAAIEGGAAASVWENWLEGLNDKIIYELCHFSVGLNPKAKITGNMIEDERVVGSVTFGFGNQDSDFKGDVGPGRFHADVVLTSPEIYLDGVLMSSGNKLNEELGFINLSNA